MCSSSVGAALQSCRMLEKCCSRARALTLPTPGTCWTRARTSGSNSWDELLLLKGFSLLSPLTWRQAGWKISIRKQSELSWVIQERELHFTLRICVWASCAETNTLWSTQHLQAVTLTQPPDKYLNSKHPAFYTDAVPSSVLYLCHVLVPLWGRIWNSRVRVTHRVDVGLNKGSLIHTGHSAQLWTLANLCCTRHTLRLKHTHLGTQWVHVQSLIFYQEKEKMLDSEDWLWKSLRVRNVKWR